MIFQSNTCHGRPNVWRASTAFTFTLQWLLLLVGIGTNRQILTVNAQFMSESVQDVLQSIQKVVGTVQDFVGGAQGCRYTCPAGEHPVAKPHYKASSNGCGAFGIKLDSEVSVKAVTKCCDEHDMCYDTCLQKKTVCDKAFKNCLESVCKKAKKILSKLLYNACKSTADLMYTGTLALGCKPYREAQKKACICQQKMEL